MHGVVQCNIENKKLACKRQVCCRELIPNKNSSDCHVSLEAPGMRGRQMTEPHCCAAASAAKPREMPSPLWLLLIASTSRAGLAALC
mmetsp:Transcript_1918/g.4864  ORF Transcript_1918/g.4864 Transcript_1918/m.4864 type:complete len:87 (+) Transcript_1918:530-790(+)